MLTSENINEIAAALAKAQSVIVNPAKDSENPHFKSRYADLAAGLNVVRPALSAHSVTFTQITRMDVDVMMLDTRFIHSSGQWIEGEFPVCKFPAPPQQIGSALSYARRYSLFAMVGIAGDDDDGNEASRSETPVPPRSASLSRVASYDEVASKQARDAMLDELDNCDSREQLHDWATRHSSEKALLTKDDQGTVSAAFARTQFAIKNKASAA